MGRKESNQTNKQVTIDGSCIAIDSQITIKLVI